MTPIDYYRDQCAKGVIVADPAQATILEILQQIYFALIKEQALRTSYFSLLRTPHLILGLYLWGGVGAGKTFLMDCFFTCLPFPEKMRVHFHEFMRLIHQELKQHQGEPDPLYIIAKELAKKTQVICFDEFFVSDVADAMLLGRLLKALFAQGVCLVCTSNVMPDDLYKNGLQRDQFLPAIALIKKDTTVAQITVNKDYRLRHLKTAGVFYDARDKNSAANMDKAFNALAGATPPITDPININDRWVPIRKQAGKMIWFDFHVLCTPPRSQQDYLVIAENYTTVFISDIPSIPDHDRDTICLFINLIDVLYDAHVRLIFSAAEPLEEIYQHGQMALEYGRTHSRLIEMQSEDYFGPRLNSL